MEQSHQPCFDKPLDTRAGIITGLFYFILRNLSVTFICATRYFARCQFRDFFERLLWVGLGVESSFRLEGKRKKSIYSSTIGEGL